MRHPISLIALLLVAPPAQTVVPDGQRAKSFVEYLASDTLQGRRSGLPSGEKAAAWIAGQFQSFGLRPGVGDTTFFQNFTITTAIESGPMVLKTWSAGKDSLEFQYSRDFASFAYGGSGKVQGQLVFVGYGIHAPGKGRDDYAGVDLKGKIAVALRGAPDRGEDFWEGESWHGWKVATACSTGAAGYLHIGGGKAMQRTVGFEHYRKDFPAFWISRETCDRIFQMVGLTFDSLLARTQAHPEGYHIELPIEVSMESHAGVIENAATRNVLAFVPGADPQLAHEIVLIGAHMDHLGVNAAGQVLHGADDNASGAASVMELARTLILDPIPPRRSVYFCTFAAEDLGLMGSEEFVAHPPAPLDSIVTMIDMDMVGLGDQGVELGGWCNFPQIAAIWNAALSDSQRARIQHSKPGGGSDHAPFEAVGIPAFFVASAGDHPNYHQPEDEAQYIRPETLAEVGEVVYRGLRAVADYPAPLANPNRMADYLWQTSETAMLGAPDISMKTEGGHPDLILYEAGKSIDPASRNRLRRLLVEIEQLDSILAQGKSEITRIDSFKNIPTGGLHPALALGIASPKLVENEPEIFRTLGKLGVLFVHVPVDARGSYFGVRGMKKPGRDLLTQLVGAPQQIIWDVVSFHQAQQLMAASSRPLVIRILTANDKEMVKSIKPNRNDFLLLCARVAAQLSKQEFESLEKTVGWMNLGIEAANGEDAKPLLDRWLEWGYKQRKMTNLLGSNLNRFMASL